MGWFSFKKSKENDRLKALAAANEIALIQMEIGTAAEGLYEKLHTFYAMGYLFGLYQASLEVIAKSELTDTDYALHIGQGFEHVYQSPPYGQKMYGTARQYLGNKEFHVGRLAGAEDYISLKNDSSYRPIGLATFLLNTDPP